LTALLADARIDVFGSFADTVGELRRVENCTSHMASLKAQDHGNLYVERLAWEGGNRIRQPIMPKWATHICEAS
jgi:hypothetical protein